MQSLIDIPVIDGAVRIPFPLITDKQAREMENRLTFKQKSFRPGEPAKVISTLRVDSENEVAIVPFAYGLKLLQEWGCGAEYDEVISDGLPFGKVAKFPDPHHPSAPPTQAEFFKDLLEACKEHRTIIAVAPTGSGKTVAGLNTIAKLGRKACVVVPSKELALQWRAEAIEHLGLKDSEIGSWEAGKCDHKGKKLVIAVIHNVYQMDVPEDVRNEFGTVIWDEVHRLGAEMFSSTFSKFCARVRIGLTATPDRKDGLGQIVFDCFGPPRVIAQGDALPCEVRVVKHHTVMQNWAAGGRGVLINRLTKNQSRNSFICRVVKAMVGDGRNILVLSDRIEHLTRLRDQCIAEGIDPSIIGQYTRSFIREDGTKGTFKKEELAAVRENSQVILSTYGMGKEAVNIPRLDAGIDATPRADGVQAIGRIRRPYPNKKKPIWFTIRDVGIAMLDRMTDSRVRDYRNSGAEVKLY